MNTNNKDFGKFKTYSAKILIDSQQARQQAESYIRRVFRIVHKARSVSFLKNILTLNNPQGEIDGTIGFTLPAEKFYLEQYLGEPIELLLSKELSSEVSREKIVEVGNLAALSCGGGRFLLSCLTQYLLSQGYEFAIFTATDKLQNLFSHMQACMTDLALADPSTLPDKGDGWGDYYKQNPRIKAIHLRRFNESLKESSNYDYYENTIQNLLQDIG